MCQILLIFLQCMLWTIKIDFLASTCWTKDVLRKLVSLSSIFLPPVVPGETLTWNKRWQFSVGQCALPACTDAEATGCPANATCTASGEQCTCSTGFHEAVDTVTCAAGKSLPFPSVCASLYAARYGRVANIGILLCFNVLLKICHSVRVGKPF